MPAITFVFVVLCVVCRVSLAGAQTVVVPATTFGPVGTEILPNSTAMLDHDSVFMAFTTRSPEIGTVRFQVVNIDTGAIELAPVALPGGTIEASVAVLAPDTGVVVVRDENDASKGKYFVVNPLTGVIVHGPISFTSHGTSWQYRLTVVDPSTLLIAHRSDDRLKGTFVVVDPQTATVKVPETTFAVPINVMEVAAVDARHVAIVYDTPGPDTRVFFNVVDAQDGFIVRPSEELGSGYPSALIQRSPTEVLLAASGGLRTLDLITGTFKSSGGYAVGQHWGPAITVFGGRSVFAASSPIHLPFIEGPVEYVVHDIDGANLVPFTPFSAKGSRHLSAVSSGCRVFIAYHDDPEVQKGTFQVLDFSNVCTPPPCPPDITAELELGVSPFIPFYVPWLQLQLVLVRNRTPQPIEGPLSLVLDDLQGAHVIGAGSTGCRPGQSLPLLRFGAGADDVLSPGEVRGAWLLFLKTTEDSITYRPQVLKGIPSR